MSRCEHDWQRAPDRDLISTPPNGGGFVDLVLWCPKCGRAKTERVNFPLRDGSARAEHLEGGDVT